MRKLILTLFYALTCTYCNAQETADIVDLNPANFNTDFSSYNQKTAVYCAEIADLAYASPDYIKDFTTLVQSLYPDMNIRSECLPLPREKNKQALFWGNKHFVLVAFKGTDPKKLNDIITDIKYWEYSNNPEDDAELNNMPGGHGGFRRAVMDFMDAGIFEKLSAFIQKCNPGADARTFPVYLTGHSLGSGIAQIFVKPLEVKGFKFKGMYNFAPPLAVSIRQNQEMVKKYNAVTYDVVNYKDYIARAGRNGVEHFGQFYRICDDGDIYLEEEEYCKFRWHEYFKELEYHKISNHVSALKSAKNTPELIHQRSDTKCSCLMLPDCYKK